MTKPNKNIKDNSVEQTFDDWASTDRAQKMTAGHAHIYDAYFWNLSESCPIQIKDLAILDAACGYGEILRRAANQGHKDQGHNHQAQAVHKQLAARI